MTGIVSSERLIQAVKKYPCIWNIHIEDNNAKLKKNECWNEICEAVYGDDWESSTNKEGNLVKKNDLRKKWHNIRDYYKNMLVSEKQTSIKGSMKKRRKYIFADLLEFLRPVYEGDRDTPISEEYLEESWDQDFSAVDREDILAFESPPICTQKRTQSFGNTESSEDDADLLFFKSLIPHMKKLGDSQKFDFKLGIMQLYKKIKYRPSSDD